MRLMNSAFGEAALPKEAEQVLRKFLDRMSTFMINQSESGIILARSDAERRRMAISKDTAAEQGGKKLVHKLERWIRLPTNDRPEPTRSYD
jgi:hypothetical protein